MESQLMLIQGENLKRNLMQLSIADLGYDESQAQASFLLIEANINQKVHVIVAPITENKKLRETF